MGKESLWHLPTVPGGPPEPRPCPKLLQGSVGPTTIQHQTWLGPQSITQHLPKSASSTIDPGDKYAFPTHIVSTDLRPDIVWWDDTCRSVCLVELTVCFDTLSQDAVTRKESNYLDLLSAVQQTGYRASLITLEVGSRGLPNIDGFRRLKQELKLTTSQLTDLMVKAARQAIIGSYNIWCSRNRGT